MKKHKKLKKRFRISSYLLLFWLMLFLLVQVINSKFYEKNKIWINFPGIAISISGIINTWNIMYYEKEKGFSIFEE
jgi:hypothetical protein